MNRSSYFTIDNISQDIEIDLNSIRSEGDFICPWLIIGFIFKFHLVGKNRDQGFLITNVEIKLRPEGFKGEAVRINQTVNYEVEREGNLHIYPKFPLTREIVEFIEKNRKDDFKCFVTLKIFYGKIIKINGSGNQVEEKFNIIKDYNHGNVNQLEFSIPQSTWVKNILPGFGYKAFRLIEIPEAVEIISPEYKNSINELKFTLKQKILPQRPIIHTQRNILIVKEHKLFIS